MTFFKLTHKQLFSVVIHITCVYDILKLPKSQAEQHDTEPVYNPNSSGICKTKKCDYQCKNDEYSAFHQSTIHLLGICHRGEHSPL